MLFFIICILMMQVNSIAQIQFGVKAGVPFNMGNLEIRNAKIETSRPFNLGLTSEFISSSINLGFEISALYELERISGQSMLNSVDVNYLILPVNLKWKLGFSPVRAFVFAGPSIEILLYKTGNVIIKNETTTKGDSKALPLTTSYSPNNFNWGVNAGLGIEIMMVQVGIAFFYNFDKPLKEIPNDLYYQYDTSNNTIKSKQNGLVLSLTCFF